MSWNFCYFNYLIRSSRGVYACIDIIFELNIDKLFGQINVDYMAAINSWGLHFLYDI